MRWRTRGEVVVGGEEAVQECAVGYHVEYDEEGSDEKEIQQHRLKLYYNNVPAH